MDSSGFMETLKRNLPPPVVEAAIYFKHAGRRLHNSRLYAAYTAGKHGIEIGGPSRLFKTTLPIYRNISSLDGVNFSNHTTWEGSLKPGRHFNYFGTKKGIQFISEATELTEIDSCAYDFVLSSNCLEHIANPLKALMEWRRVTKIGGALILVLPNKAANFDHKRPCTTFEHILDDLHSNKGEQDLTHLDEILSLHDLSMDSHAGTLEAFKTRCLDNLHNRTLHHHVFDVNLMERMLHYLDFDVIDTSETATDLFALAIKRY